MTYSSITPGSPWLDTAGKPIHAHGGSMFIEGGVYYWYGENKEHSVPGSGVWHWGVRCYRSTDLYNWEDLGLIIPPDVDDETSPLNPRRQLDRPHIVFNERTGKYLCWIKVMGERTQLTTVLAADALLGPYEIVTRDLRPLGMSAGDFDLAIDPHDGKGYYFFERVHSELICADLDEEYTNVTGYYSTHFLYGHPPYVREAPAHFRRGDKHYLITSGTTHYFPNQSEAAVAMTYHGPWTVLGDPHPGDASHTSFRSQISCIFKHPTVADLYIAMADRWLPEVSAAEAALVPEIFERIMTAGGPPAPGTVPAFVDDVVQAADTSISTYVWLPIRFEGDMPIIDWRDQWRIEDFA